VRQHAGVVEQFLSIDGGLGYVLKAQEEELQRLPTIGREQFPQWTSRNTARGFTPTVSGVFPYGRLYLGTKARLQGRACGVGR
jgi:small-conductance mechanosensitive channel